MKIIRTDDDGFAVRALRWDFLFCLVMTRDPFVYLDRDGDHWWPQLPSDGGQTMARRWARCNTLEEAERAIGRHKSGARRIRRIRHHR